MAQNNDREGPKRRTRGAIACSSCRRRRVKCVKSPDEDSCEQCQRNRVECVMSRDERKQETSRSYLSYLKDRVDVLTTSLHEIESQRAAADILQPMPGRNSSGNEEMFSAAEFANEAQIPNAGQDVDTAMHTEDNQFTFSDDLFDPIFFAAPSCHTEGSGDAASPTQALVNEILSTTGHLKFDQSNGRWRYFGPTTNFHHVCSQDSAAMDDSLEQMKQTKRVLKNLSPELHDHLLESYWLYCNPIFQVVDRDVFESDQERGETRYYSGFLHVTMLAMGFRFSDRSRPDVQKPIVSGTRESSLHRQAKYLSEYELERPGGLPSIQALVLLSSLESGCGRDNAGWMYAGMGFRLAFDVGLNLEGSRLGIFEEKELELRRKLLRSCVLLDRYWSLYLGRCNSIKSSDLPPGILTSEESHSTQSDTDDIQEQIFGLFLSLMGICCRITKQLESIVSTSDCNSLFAVAALDRELGAWHSNLPENLRHGAQRAETAPLNYFLMHQAYHCAMILLYRPFTHYELSNSRSQVDMGRTSTQIAIIARKICCDNAISLTETFRQLCLRCEPSKVTLFAMQHAGAAAAVLIAAMRDNQDKEKHATLLPHLVFLTDILRQMAVTYQPAEKMSIILHRILEDPLYDQGLHALDIRRSSIATQQPRAGVMDDIFAAELSNENFATTFHSFVELSNTFGSFEETQRPSFPGAPASCAFQQPQPIIPQGDHIAQC